MTVHIKRETCGGVTQVCLYSLDIVSALDGGNCIAVSQVMEAGSVVSEGADSLLEILIDRQVDQMSTDLIGEHQAGRITPSVSGKRALFLLSP